MLQAAVTAANIAHGLAQVTVPLNAKWHRISAPHLPRSSHTLSVVSGRAYIFGGEVEPREPVDNYMHVVTLPSGTATDADYQSIPAKPANGREVPEKRVGHTAAVVGEKIFVFGGRGGLDMKPLEEHGRMWVYDTRTDTWEVLVPSSKMPYPPARSYHASIGIDTPRPPASKVKPANPVTEEPAIGTIATAAGGDAEAYGTIFVHAGCASSGRTNDLWAFDIADKTWKQFPDAPSAPRGGASIAHAKNRLYRYGGFNGNTQEGGQIDYLDLGVEVFNDEALRGEVGITAKMGEWNSFVFTEENMLCPGPRSVTGLHTITTGMGREYLILLLGERDTSPEGHAGAGEFYDDVWAFQLPPQGMTGASFKDATWQALGRETGEALWSQVNAIDAEGEEGDDVRALVPNPRGWFGSSGIGDLDRRSVIIWGGLNGHNERLGDGWILKVH